MHISPFDIAVTRTYPMAWKPVETPFIRASLASRCIRHQTLNALGFAPSLSYKTKALLEVGTVIHRIFQDAIMAAAPDAQCEVRYETNIGGILAIATIDLVWGNHGYNLKTIGYKDNYTELDGYNTYTAQLEMEHRISRLPMSILITSRVFPLSKFTKRIFTPSEERWERLLLDIASIRYHITKKTLPERPQNLDECVDCGFSELCATIDAGLANPFEDVVKQIEKGVINCVIGDEQTHALGPISNSCASNAI